MQTNYTRKLAPTFTAEGARAAHITSVQQLRRLVMSCMLWEDNFYIDGKSIAEIIQKAVWAVPLADAGAIAVEARNTMKLRHVPLLIVREMARHPKLKTNPKAVSEALANVIQRPDELNEFVSIYWKDGKQPLSKQVKLGLAKAFTKFNEYSLAKYNRKKDIMLRDVLFLCHSKPADVPADAKHWDKITRQTHAKQAGVYPQARFYEQIRPDGPTQGELLYGKLVYDQLEVPDTWEVELSAGADKRKTFERLMHENKLGDLAFLRNLRNMREAGVPIAQISAYGNTRNWGRVLPFRFISAARIVPALQEELENWMFKCLEGTPMLMGHTVLMVDISGSMQDKLSAKSDLSRLDTAKALAMLLREICEKVTVCTFDTRVELVDPTKRGFALDAAIGSPRGGTDVGLAVSRGNQMHPDRLIVLTDEQSHTRVGEPQGRGYMINVATNKHGVGYGKWLHVDGFSEAIIDYIQYYELEEA